MNGDGVHNMVIAICSYVVIPKLLFEQLVILKKENFSLKMLVVLVIKVAIFLFVEVVLLPPILKKDVRVSLELLNSHPIVDHYTD